MTWLGNNFWKSNLPSGTHLSKGKVYLFFNLTIKSLEQSRCCHSAVLVGSFNHDLRITYCWLWRLHWICLEQSSSKKCPKDSEASAFPCCILNNTQFLKTSHGNKKKNHDVKKSRGVSKQNDICKRYLFVMKIMYTKHQNYSLCCR